MKKLIGTVAIGILLSGNPTKADEISKGTPDTISGIKTTQLVSKNKEITEKTLNTKEYVLPEWTQKKNNGMVESAKEVLDKLEAEGKTNPYIKVKAQKLKKIIAEIDGLNIYDQRKIYLISKYLEGGKDSIVHLKEVIDTINKSEIIYSYYPEGEIKKTINSGIDFVITNYSLFETTTPEFINGLQIIAGGDFTKGTPNKQFIGKLLEINGFNNHLFNDLILDSNKNGIKDQNFNEKMKNIISNFEFIKEYSTFDYSKLNKQKDENTEKFLDHVKSGLDNHIRTESYKDARELFNFLVDNSSEGFFKIMDNYKGDKKLYDRILNLTGRSFIGGKVDYSEMKKKLLAFKKINTEINSFQINSIKPEKVKSFSSAILKGDISIEDYKEIKHLDETITRIKNQNKFKFLTENELNHFISSSVSGNYNIKTVSRNLEYINSLDVPEKDRSFFMDIIRFLILDPKRQNEIPEYRSNILPEDFEKTTEKVKNFALEFKGYKYHKILKFSKKFGLILDVVNGRISEKEFLEKVSYYNTLHDLVDKKIIDESQANEIITALYSNKINTNTYRFIVNDFLKAENKGKYIIPNKVFKSESITKEYQEIICQSLFNGDIDENRIKYIFSDLLADGNSNSKIFESMSAKDKMDFFEAKITGKMK